MSWYDDEHNVTHNNNNHHDDNNNNNNNNNTSVRPEICDLRSVIVPSASVDDTKVKSPLAGENCMMLDPQYDQIRSNMSWLR